MSVIARFLARSAGLGVSETRRLIISAPERYRVFKIDKRSGGEREIAQPTPEIKFLQRIFLTQFLERLPVHPCATAYIRGKSLRDNAAPHAGNGPILKMDFADFFPSIRSRDWRAYCEEKGILQDEEDLYLTERLLFFRRRGTRMLRLSIGAPTSPMISNLLMYDFDERVRTAVSRDHVTYTRYADDLTFSARRTGYLVNVQKDIKRIIRAQAYPKLKINKEKTTYVTAKYHRQVTGLTLSNDGRVTIGRDLKRVISAKVHHYASGRLEEDSIPQLSGLLAYVNAVEPAFLNVLGEKYDFSVLEEIRSYAKILHAENDT
jgi:Reverse transcriptase (RNA-dependent DNA polymerase).